MECIVLEGGTLNSHSEGHWFKFKPGDWLSSLRFFICFLLLKAGMWIETIRQTIHSIYDDNDCLGCDTE